MGAPLVAVHGLLISGASLVAECRLSAVGFVVVAPGLIGVSLGCAGFHSCGLGLVASLCLSFPTHGTIPWSRRENGCEGLERHDYALKAAVFIF